MKEDLEKIFNEYAKEQNPIIISTKECAMVNGRGNEILTLLTIMMKHLQENGFTKDMAEDVVRVAFMSEKEVCKEIIEKIKKQFNMKED